VSSCASRLRDLLTSCHTEGDSLRGRGVHSKQTNGAWLVRRWWALSIPILVLGIVWLWAMLVEIIRRGNEHVGYRERTESLRPNCLVMFEIGIAALGSVVVKVRSENTQERQAGTECFLHERL
jgi:hypothetical protein